MKNFSVRQKFIISILLDVSKISITELSKQMDISERTVSREVSFINKVLKDDGIKIFVKNSVIALDGDKKNIELLKDSLGTIPKRRLLSSKQKIIFIAAQLLLADKPYKSAFFSYQVDVTEGTVSIYMDSISKWLAGKDLVLNRKRGCGIQIEGPEWRKRNALVSLIYDYKPVEELLPYFYGTKDEPVFQSFLNYLFSERVIKISKEILKLIPDEEFDDIFYLTSLFYTMISIRKSISGSPIFLPEDVIHKIVPVTKYSFDKNLRKYLSECSITLPESEIAYISLHLLGKYIYNTDERVKKLGITTRELAKEVLYEVQKNWVGTEISKNELYITTLAHYFDVVLYRINLGIQVRNELLDQVREHYKALFNTVQTACRRVFSRYNLYFSEDEISFITMDIGTILEKEEHTNKKYSILIVCPNGLFASRILMNKVKGIIHNIDTIDIASLRDWSVQDCEKYDLILSTVNLDTGQERSKNNVIVVSPFLSEDDISKINRFVQKLQMRKTEAGKPAHFDMKCAEKPEGLEAIHKMYDSIFLSSLMPGPFEDMIDCITKELYKKGVVKDNREILRLILEREKIGSVVIPNSSVSLLHIRSDDVNYPFIGIYRIRGKIMMDTVGFVKEPVDTFLVLLARSNEYSSVLEKMGDISISLVENKDFTQMLRTSDIGKLQAQFKNLLTC